VVEPSRRELRPDIQGLRALAVGLVLIYHLWPDRLPGGFVGVDVFFVISGFLIGGHLLAELEATGRLRLGRFWARRARRLLPASLLVLVAVTAATLLLAPLSTRSDVLAQVVGSTLYVQNWVLADQSVDYLAIGNAPTPVQHYWSLAVEEQLYVALPLVLLAVLFVTRGRRRLTAPVVALAVLCAASLVWSVASTQSDPGVAYFSTLTRTWEFLAGTLLAAVVRQPGRPSVRSVAGGVGLAAVVASAFVLDGGSLFPGWVALVPVAGTVLVIAARDRGPLALASSWRPVTWLGDVSYAVYLWHWPLLVLLPYVTDEPLTTAHKLMVLVATLVLSAASTYLVEQPVRMSPLLRTGRRGRGVLVGLAVTSVAVAATAAWLAGAATEQQEQQLADAQERLLSGDLRCLGASAMDPTVTGCELPDDLLVPPPSSAAIDDHNRDECWAGFGVAELRLCGFGSDDPAATRVLAVGDSHNNVYLPAYEALADTLGWHVDVAGRAGCTWGARSQTGRTTAIAAECNAWKQALAEHLTESDPYDLILTTGDQFGFPAVPEPGETEREATVRAHSEAWAEQIARGTAVVAILDYPAAVPGVVQCVEEHGAEGAVACARPRAKALAGFDALAEAVESTPGSAALDLRDLMCTPRTCPAVIGHVVVYRNRDHLTASFVRTLAPYVVARLPTAQAAALASSG
jgi:peptidoglycan/LPS O-acetylase OafA/YrhL